MYRSCMITRPPVVGLGEGVELGEPRHMTMRELALLFGVPAVSLQEELAGLHGQVKRLREEYSHFRILWDGGRGLCFQGGRW